MQDAKGQGVAISHSITCSTALHALLNGIAWLHADMAEGLLVGGSEAPLTPFTLSQMKALKIYGSLSDSYPCQPLLLEKLKNTMVLGEGSAVFAIEKGVRPNALAIVKGIGYATEVITHPVAISAQAEALRLSMQQALQGVAPAEVDVVIPHATGTIKGDEAEYPQGGFWPELATTYLQQMEDRAHLCCQWCLSYRDGGTHAPESAVFATTLSEERGRSSS